MSSPPVLRSQSSTVPRLRVLLAASFIVPALLFAASAWQDRRVLLGEAGRRAEKTSEILEQHAAAAFNAYELIFARIVEHMRAAPDESESVRHSYLAGIDHELREVGSLFLVDGPGRITAHSRYFPVPQSSVTDRDYYQALAGVANKAKGAPPAATSPVLDESGLAVGAPVSGRFSGTPKLNIARAIPTAGGPFAGAMAISVSQDYFESFLRTVSESPLDSMAIVRADGTILARSPALPGDQLARVQNPATSQSLLARITSGVSVYTSPVDKVERISAYRKLAGYPIYVGYGLSTAAVLRVWYEHIAIYGCVALVAALTLFGVTWLALRTAQEEDRARSSLVGEMARREAAEAALRQAQKMEAIGQLTGGIAHDFNNLLAAVLGNLELLAKRLPDEPRLRRHMDAAIEGARRGAALTQRMLAFSRRQDLKLEAVDIPALVRGMMELLTRSIGLSIRVETHFPSELTLGRVDANQLEMALLNLAVNARDAMPNGGAITITAREEAVHSANAPGLPDGRYVVLAMSDTGEGMDAATLARASEPFFTTKPVGKGTGLGLAMVHGLVAQAGGALRIQSEVGRGTTAELWLPVAAAGDGRPAVSGSVPVTKATASRRVLLVDDDPLVLVGTSAMLEDLGHHVIEARSGQDALDVLRRGTPVDLLVTDYMMPGMTGLTLALNARGLRPGLPILLASGFAELSESELSQLTRLPKPFTLGALSQAIAEVMQHCEDDAPPERMSARA